MNDKELLQTITALLDSRDERLLEAIGELKSAMQSEFVAVESDLSDIKDRVKCIELSLENDIPKRLDSLYEGYQGNREMIEELKVMEQETNSMVSALDIAKFVQSGNGQNLKIVK